MPSVETQRPAPAPNIPENTPAMEVDAHAEASYVECVPIDRKGKKCTVIVSQVDYILAAGSCAELHVGDLRFFVREALHVLERRLDPRMFMRIHQSSIVRLACVHRFVPAESGDHEIQLTNGTWLRVSRSRRDALQRRLADG
jgi:two-component system, LytTR family, response regulator